MPKSCIFEDCHSNSRLHPNIEFAAFVKPSQDSKRAKAWVKRVARLDFEVETITKNTYVCSKHFPPGSDLQYWTNPDLIPYQNGQALTQYLRSERRRSREEPNKELNVRFQHESLNKTYRKLDPKIVNIKRVEVLCGVPVPVHFNESDISAATSSNLEISLPGNIFFAFEFVTMITKKQAKKNKEHAQKIVKLTI